jgi:hypothetical protein
MSKGVTLAATTLVLVAVITATTFLVSGHNSAVTCFPSDDTSITQGIKPSQDSPPIEAAVRGFPFWYYQAPLPLDCMNSDGGVSMASTSTANFNGAHFAGDLLIWILLAFPISFGLTKARAKK